MAFGRLDDVFVAGGGRRWLVLACAGLYATTHDFNFIWSSDLKTEMLLRRLDGSMMSVLVSKCSDDARQVEKMCDRPTKRYGSVIV